MLCLGEAIQDESNQDVEINDSEEESFDLTLENELD